MANELNFHFPLPLLLQDGDLILNAAEAHPGEITPRLSANHVAETRTLAVLVSTQDAAQKSDAGDLGNLTLEQNTKLKTLNERLSSVRETAKRAFKGQDVKLREEFQVGGNKPKDLGAVIQRARIVLAAVQKAENTGPLTAKGWLAADTTALETAIDELDETDNTQEGAKTKRTGTTGTRNRNANDLYERLLTIQNAANLQWPASNSVNAPIRDEFRLGKFPPRGGSSPQPPPTPPTPPPA
jgi:hypothetical protein